MPRIFVFGIGGTGSRIMKALTITLAAGVNLNGYDLVPIFIDPHKDLPEFKDCKELVSIYTDLHRAAYAHQQPGAGAFFHTPIVSLGDASGGEIASGFDFDERIDETFGEFLDLHLLDKGDINRDLTELLFSEKNLNTPLSVGFKGNPNIGSVVLNKMDQAGWYKAFENIFSDQDRIFIISSIFGGTGAAGFPLLVKNLRESSNKYIQRAMIGALPVMPYFKLGEPDKDAEHADIDSNSFFTKTKSALSYYENHLTGVDALYYLADLHEQSVPYKNDEKLQDNKAHLIELIGASAIIDFSQKTGDGNKTERFYHYTPAENTSPIHFYNLGNQLRDQLYLPLVNFYVFAQVHDTFKKHPDATAIKNEKFDAHFFRSDAVTALERYFQRYFLKWIAELAQNDRQFAPFNLRLEADKFHKLVVGNPLKEKKFLVMAYTFDHSNYLNSLENSRNEVAHLSGADKFSRYLILAQKAMQSVNQKKFKL